MDSNSSRKSREQLLQKSFESRIRQNIDKCTVIDKKVDLNISLCENLLKQIVIDRNNGLEIPCAANSNISYDICSWTVEHCQPIISSSMKQYIDTCETVYDPTELVRLGSVSKYTDSTLLHLGAEEAQLLAEIECLTDCLKTPSKESSDHCATEIPQLDSECKVLKEKCLISIDRAKWKDCLKVRCLKAARRTDRQQTCLLELDKQISTTKSECTKFQISHDILTLEDNALLELAQCLDKISSVLQTYIDLSSDSMVRLGSSRKYSTVGSEDNEHVPSSTHAPLYDIDSDLRMSLRHIVEESHPQLNIEFHSLTDLNNQILSVVDERLELLKTNHAENLALTIEFSRGASKLCELVAKAIRRLDCSTTEGAGAIGRGGGDDQPSSSPVYWNELSSMTGVFRQRLIQKLVEVRQLLDGLTGGLHRLEVSYEINAD